MVSFSGPFLYLAGIFPESKQTEQIVFITAMKEKGNLRIKPDIDELTGEERGVKRLLVLHNDDIHTFDFVIDTLIEICELEVVQAEQCTYLVHYKGKCDVKKGSYHYLKPYKQGLIDRGLNATID